MAACLLAMLTLFSDVGLHLDEVDGLSLEQAIVVAERLGDALAPRAGGRFVLDDPLWPECPDRGRCLQEVKLRTKTQEIVYLRVYGGPTRIRLIAERLTAPDIPAVEADLRRKPPPDAARFEALAVQLFPEPLSARVRTDSSDRSPVSETRSEPPRPSQFGAWPYITAGVGVAAVAVGGGFGLVSRSARDRIENEALSDAEYNRELSRMEDFGNTANVLFAAGGAIAVTGLVLWLLD